LSKVTPLRARYDAGYSNDYHTTPPVSEAADAEIYAAGQRLRDWARDLAKNSSIVKSILDARVAKGVGTGLRYEPMVVDRKGALLTGLNAAITDAVERWAEAADVTGELSRAELERIVWRDWDCAGEVFARKVYRGRTADRLGLQVQLIRSELVPYAFLGDARATMGIERDEWGKPVTYWVYPYVPSPNLWPYYNSAFQPKAVGAEQMVHLRRQEEVDATRGVTLLHAVIFRIDGVSRYQESHRRAARASANLFASLNRSIDFDPASDQNSTTRNEIDLSDLQLIDWLKPGEGVNFHAPSHPNQNATEFVNQELRQIASSCRVAFSWIAYVFDRAYAAQRTELIHAWEMILEDRAQFIRDFAEPVLYREPVRLALLEGRLPARELRRADPKSLYAVRIDGPAMPTIDPVADRQAAQLDQEQGWDSRPAIIRRFGRNPTHVDAERAKDPFKVEQPAPPVTEAPDDEDDDEPI
jgi:lambda family phage portal protein